MKQAGIEDFELKMGDILSVSPENPFGGYQVFIEVHGAEATHDALLKAFPEFDWSGKVVSDTVFPGVR